MKDLYAGILIVFIAMMTLTEVVSCQWHTDNIVFEGAKIGLNCTNQAAVIACHK